MLKNILKKYRLQVSIFKITFYIIIPIIVLVLPIDFFDGKDNSICLSVNLLNIECYACGITSAIMHLIHLDFETAFAYNMLSFLVFPSLSILWLSWFLEEVRKVKSYKSIY